MINAEKMIFLHAIKITIPTNFNEISFNWINDY